MNSEPVRLRSRVSARRGQGYFTPLAILSSRTTAAQKDKKRGLPSVQSLE